MYLYVLSNSATGWRVCLTFRGKGPLDIVQYCTVDYIIHDTIRYNIKTKRYLDDIVNPLVILDSTLHVQTAERLCDTGLYVLLQSQKQQNK